MLRGQGLIWNICHTSICNPPLECSRAIVYEEVLGPCDVIFMVGIVNTIVLALCSGEILKTKNYDFSRSGAFDKAFEHVLRPQQHSRKRYEHLIWTRGSISVANARFICLMNNSHKIQQSSFLGNQSSNDEARAHPEIVMT